VKDRTPSRFCARRRAFSLAELGIVLGIVSIVMGAIWAVATSVLAKNQQRVAQEQVMTIVQNMRNFYGVSGASFPSTNINATLDANGIFPLEMRKDRTTASATILHAFGRPLTVSFPNASSFRLLLSKISQKDCIGFLMTFPFLLPEIGACELAVNNSTATGCVEKNTGNGSLAQIFIDPTNYIKPSSGNYLSPLTVKNATLICKNSSNEVALDFWIRN
jgi:type II secretory pathway pseudopilin PulG